MNPLWEEKNMPGSIIRRVTLVKESIPQVRTRRSADKIL